jgi:archaellum biogenesis ATPase FlaH
MNILSQYMKWQDKSSAGSSKSKPSDSANDGSYSSTEEKGVSSDEEVLQKLFNASNGADNIKLYNGDTSKYKDDHSAADLAFVNKVAFYTQIPEQIDHIYRQSKLIRDKWDKAHSSSGETYGEMTISKALANLDSTYAGQPKKQPMPKTFEFINGEQLLERPMQTDWLIRNYIPADATVMLFGAPASGKSLIALEMASCIISGEDWHNQPVKQGVVAYIAGEGFNGISKRFKALAINKAMPVEHFHCSKIAMDLFDEESSLSVLCAVQAMKDLRLIIVDTLHRNFSGDENQSSNFATALKHCDRLRNATGATIMLVHHSGHKSSDRGRGSSSMTGAMDAEFQASNDGGVKIHCTKMKDDEMPKDIKFKINSVVIGHDEDGKPITAPLLVKSTTFFSTDKSASLNATDKQTLDVLIQLSGEVAKPIPKSEWMAASSEKYSVITSAKNPDEAKRKKFERSMKALIEHGLVAEDNGCYTVAVAEETTEGEDE